MAKKKTYEQFLIDVYNHLGEENYKVLSKTYPGGHGKVELLHYQCGNTFLKNVHDIISKNSGCPYCNGSRPALYNEKWVKDHTPEPYYYVSGYTSMKEKCIFHCNKCGIDFEQLPSRLINQHLYGCNCCKTKKITQEEFLERLGPECLEEYEVLDQYINMNTKIRFKHKKCGTIFSLEPDKFITRNHKKYCPTCYLKKSKGEIIIENYFKNNNIDYQREFIFPDLPSKRFDFYLPDYKIAIEFDGIQHFQPIQKFGGQEEFILTQQRDKIKNQFCLNNYITLLRIPYTEIDNLPQILYQIFKEKSSTTIEKFKVFE